MSDSPTTQRRTERLAELSLFGAGVAYGASTPVGRELGTWFAPLTITALRFAFALPFCLLVYWRTPRLRTAAVRRLVPIALLFPTAAALFTFALFNGTIAVAVFGFYLANLLSSLLVGVLINREALDRPTIIAFTCSFAASAAFVYGELDLGGANVIGLLTAVGSGVCNTAISQEQKRLSKNFDGETITLAEVAGGAIATAIVVIVVGDSSVTAMTGTGLAMVALYGCLFFFCNRLTVFGFKHGPIGLGTVLLSVEVVVGPALAYLFFTEAITLAQLIGGVLTGLAVIATALRSRPPVITID